MSPEPTGTPPVDRPDLKKESLFFTAVKGIGMGAVWGAAVTLSLATLGVLTKGRWGSRTASFKQGISDNLGFTAVFAGALGLTNLLSAAVRNDDRKQIRPYVEKLERERESLAKSIPQK